MRLLRPEYRVLTLAGLAAAFSVIVLCLLLIVRSSTNQQFQIQTATNCMNIESLKSTIRATFLEAQTRALARKDLDPAQRTEIENAYAKEFARYAPAECPSVP